MVMAMFARPRRSLTTLSGMPADSAAVAVAHVVQPDAREAGRPGATDPPRTIHDPREVPIPRSELRVVLTVAVAEEPARWASVGVLCGFLIRLPLLRPLELRRAA
jgi:hypothetical protein